MQMRLLIIAVIALTLRCETAKSQTLHYISVAETADVQLPKEFTVNRNAFDAFIASIANEDGGNSITGLKLVKTTVDGASFDCNTITNIVDTLKVESADDVIVFYYSGHGESPKKNAKDDTKSEFPKLLCGKTAHDKMPTLEDIYGKLKNSGARFVMVGADSCNNIVQQPEFSVVISEEIQRAKGPIRDMFRNYHGYILITGAKAGEFSFYRDHSLGYFTEQLLGAINSTSVIPSGEIWNAVLARATAVIEIPPHKQLPDESPVQKLQHPVLKKELTH